MTISAIHKLRLNLLLQMIIVTDIVRSDVHLLAIISIILDLPTKKKKNKKRKEEEDGGKEVNLFFAVNISPRQTHSSFRRQVLPGRLKSQAVQISSVTIDGGCN